MLQAENLFRRKRSILTTAPWQEVRPEWKAACDQQLDTLQLAFSDCRDKDVMMNRAAIEDCGQEAVQMACTAKCQRQEKAKA